MVISQETAPVGKTLLRQLKTFGKLVWKWENFTSKKIRGKWESYLRFREFNENSWKMMETLILLGVGRGLFRANRSRFFDIQYVQNLQFFRGKEPRGFDDRIPKTLQPSPPPLPPLDPPPIRPSGGPGKTYLPAFLRVLWALSFFSNRNLEPFYLIRFHLLVCFFKLQQRNDLHNKSGSGKFGQRETELSAENLPSACDIIIMINVPDPLENECH